MRVANEDDELLVLQKKRLVESHAKGVPQSHYVLDIFVRDERNEILPRTTLKEPAA